MTRAGRLTLWIAATIVAITAVAGVMIAVSHGRLLVPDWYGSGPIYATVLQLVSVLAILGVYWAGVRALAGRGAGWLVAWSVLGSVAVTLGVLALGDNPLYLLFACTVSKGCTGGFSVSQELTPEMVRRWPELMPGMRLTLPHLSISAPGWPLAYRAVSGLLAGLPALSKPLAATLRPLRCDQWDFLALSNAQVASAWLGLASPLWAALTAIPLYFLGRDMAGERPARTAVAWWPLVPAPALFAATLSNTYALFGTTAVALFWGGFQARGRGKVALLLFLAGIVLGLALLLTFSLAPILLFCAVLGVCAVLARPGMRPLPGVGAALALGTIFALGILATWALFWLLSGASPLRMVFTGIGIHAALEGSYLDWVRLEGWDFVLFVGLPVAGLALTPLLTRHLGSARCLAVALSVTLPVLLLSGTARGEVGRVWIFFMPPLVLLAAAVLPQFSTDQQRGLLAAQAGWLVVLGASFTPVNSWLVLPNYARLAAAPLSTPAIPAGVLFGDALRLDGYQAQYQPDSHTLALSLRWQALQRLDHPYYFSAVLLTPDGRTLPGVHWQPLNGRFPTTCWQPGTGPAQSVVDRVDLPLGQDVQPGDWWLSLSAFGMAGDQALPALPVKLSDGKSDTQVGIGPIRVEGGG